MRDCFKNLGHLLCSNKALIIEVMGVMRMSRKYRTRKMGQTSREHDILCELMIILKSWSSVTVDQEKEMCCEVKDIVKVE